MVRQCFILFGCMAAGELITMLTGVKLPSSIIGMLLLTLLLKVKVIKLEWVRGLTDFLIANLGFFFVPPGVALMLHFDLIRAELLPIVGATLVSTALVLLVTGHTHQVVAKGEKKITNKIKDKLALTFGIYQGAKMLQRRTGSILLNPILIAIGLMIAFLTACDIPYDTYHKSGQMIEFWLKPAVVALGVPLYLQLSQIKKQILPILASQMMGCIVGIISVVATARMLGASREVVASLASKSVTTPIAMEVTQTLGGIPSLTAAIVVITGLIGGVVGFKLMAVGHIHNPMAKGLSLGAASHAVGTSVAMERDEFVGAYASLGLTLNGILTALLTPSVVELMS